MISEPPVNRCDGNSGQELVVVRVSDTINVGLAGRGGCAYESPPQPRECALTLVQLLLGRSDDVVDGSTYWSCPIAGGRRTVRLEPQPRPDGLPQSTT